MTNCLTMAEQYGVTSLIFPPFGSGYLNYPDDILTDTMLQSVVDFEQLFHSTSIDSIVIVCHRTQNSVYRVGLCITILNIWHLSFHTMHILVYCFKI